MGDVLDPPGRRAEQEDVAHPGLVDHLLVELPDPPSAGALGADEEDAEQPAVGDGAAAGDRQPLRAGPGGEGVGDAVPGQPRAQLGEGVRGVPAGEHVEDGVQRGVGQRGERRRPAHHRGHLVDRAGPLGHHRHDLLGEDVERVAQVADRLDRAGLHPLGDQRALDEVAAVLGEEHAAADRAHLVPGPADPLQPAGHRRAATRPGRPGRPRPCRCPAPGSTSRRRRAAGRTSAPPRRSPAARGTPSRGGRRRPAGCPPGSPRRTRPAPSARRRWCPGAPARPWPARRPAR